MRTTVLGEAELVLRFAAGEAGSVAEVYRAYGRLVYTVSYRVLGEAALAQDATSQTFVRAWQLAASFDTRRALGPWLATIAGTVATDIHRRERQHRLHGNRGGPDPSAEQVNDVWLVRQALDSLSAQDRELIRLQHHRQLSRTEISDRLAIPLANVKSRSRLAHRRLDVMLGRLRADHAAAQPADVDPGPHQDGCRRSR